MANPPIAPDEPIGVKITPNQIKIAPGGEPVDLIAEIRNLGTTVDQYRVEIEALDHAWYTIILTSVALFPGNSAQVPIRLHPPRGSGTLAGVYNFVVRARSQANPTVSGVAKGVLEVTPFTAFRAELKPRRVVGRKGNYKLTLTNEGNKEIQVELNGQDAEGTLNFSFKDPTPQVEPGSDVTIPVQVKAGRFRFVGKNQPYAFEIVGVPVDGTKEAARSVNGEFIHRAVFASWAIPLLTTVLGLLLIFTLCGIWTLLPRSVVSFVGQLFNPPTPTPLPAVIANFDSIENQYDLGDQVTLTWTVDNIKTGMKVYLDGNPVPADKAAYGQASFPGKKTHKFRLCVGYDNDPGHRLCQAREVTITPPTPAISPVVIVLPSVGQGSSTEVPGKATDAATSGVVTTPAGKQPTPNQNGTPSHPPATPGNPGQNGSPTQAVVATPIVQPTGLPPTQVVAATLIVRPTGAATTLRTPVGPTTEPSKVAAASPQLLQTPGQTADPSTDRLNSVSADGEANPQSIKPGETVDFLGRGFTQGEQVEYSFISPYGPLGNPQVATMNSLAAADGTIKAYIDTKTDTYPGLWTIVFTGLKSEHSSIIYFVVTPPGGPVSCDVGDAGDERAMPSSVASVRPMIAFTAKGFTPGEAVSWWFTKAGESQPALGSAAAESSFQRDGDGKLVPFVLPDGTIRFSQELPVSRLSEGNWTLTLEGEQSKHQSKIRFCITK